MADGEPLMYGQLASWWPLLSAPDDYAEEADYYRRVLEGAGVDPLETVLELGSGGGNNASHMKRRFRMTLVDASPDMQAVSRALNPECEHVLGDMRSVRLSREFDAVFVHDAIAYMTSRDDLLRAMRTARAHCRPGGAALFVPDNVSETFAPRTGHGGHDGDGRGFRYLEWVWDPDPSDTTVIADYAFLMRQEDGTVRVAHDRHEVGLFPRAVWIETLEEAGFTDVGRILFEHSEVEWGLELFLGRAPEHE
ncbi:MAG TPA: class I SAM-dependent methyltransferase [Gemmatimonadota bacterium]|nr:class I SAM-dependent methyltransferase [Gemmatimonadota bacterium]